MRWSTDRPRIPALLSCGSIWKKRSSATSPLPVKSETNKAPLSPYHNSYFWRRVKQLWSYYWFRTYHKTSQPSDVCSVFGCFNSTITAFTFDMNFWSCWYIFRLHVRCLIQIRRDFQCATQHFFINVNQWRFLCYSLQFSLQIVTKLCQNFNFFELPEIARCYCKWGHVTPASWQSRARGQWKLHWKLRQKRVRFVRAKPFYIDSLFPPYELGIDSC